MRLEDFCATEDDPRWRLHTPFTFGAWSYATDGAIAVRVPALPDYPIAGADHKIATRLAEIFERSTQAEPLQSLQVSDRSASEVCRNCQGKGTITECATCCGQGGDFNDVDKEWEDCIDCNGRGVFTGGGERCEECDGNGTLKWTAAARIGEYWIALDYLALLELLPSLRVRWVPFDGGWPRRSDGKILRFAFDGGEGVLLPRAAPDNQRGAT